MSGERTEAPTPRRLQELRSRGNAPRSQELSGALTLLAALLGLQQVATYALGQTLAALRTTLGGLSRANLAFDDIPGLFATMGPAVLALIGGVAVPAAGVALVVGMVQNGGHLAFEALRPNPGRLNPLTSMRRLLSVEALAGLIWPLLKLIAVCLAVQGPVHTVLDDLPTVVGGGLRPLLQTVGTATFETARGGAVALLVVSVLDVAYRRWQFYRNARMSRQEVREELRQSEGDPGVRGRIRSLQRKLARGRQLHDVPTASVVVTNPTHFAVALAYRTGSMAAPKVVAKGADRVATRIIELARQHRVPVVPNPPLARSLYRGVEVGQPIPTAFYAAVAEVLAYVYTVRRRR